MVFGQAIDFFIDTSFVKKKHTLKRLLPMEIMYFNITKTECNVFGHLIAC